jgi:hypothetical protein
VAPRGSCGLACVSGSWHTFCKGSQLRKIKHLTHRTHRTHRPTGGEIQGAPHPDVTTGPNTLGEKVNFPVSLCVSSAFPSHALILKASTSLVWTSMALTTTNSSDLWQPRVAFVGSALGCWVKEGWDWLIMFLQDALLK